MKNYFFLMFLLLLCLGTANVKAQVRIGGTTAPYKGAILDLNASDDATGNRGLSLPRVSLNTTTDKLNDTIPLDGTLVYNTNASLSSGTGLYYWVTNQWMKLIVYGGELHVTSVPADQNYTVTTSDDIILYNTSGTVPTLTLPTSGVTRGKTIYVTDIGSKGVTIDPAGLRNPTLKQIDPGTSITLMYTGDTNANGAYWDRISGY